MSGLSNVTSALKASETAIAIASIKIGTMSKSPTNT